MILFVGLALQALHYGLFDNDEKPWYDRPKGKLVSNKPPSSLHFYVIDYDL